MISGVKNSPSEDYSRRAALYFRLNRGSIVNTVHTTRAVLLASLITTATVLTGCGSSDDQTIVQVQGRLTVDGEPVENVVLNFNPRAEEGAVIAGPRSFGMTDANGEYKLRIGRRGAGNGAVPGRHRISFSKEEIDLDLDLYKNLVPEPYATEGFEFTIPPGGTDSADIDLSSENDKNWEQPSKS
ncbi:MAG: hypothetical protein AAF532_00670 [Planctomycetota bacterium]